MLCKVSCSWDGSLRANTLQVISSPGEEEELPDQSFPGTHAVLRRPKEDVPCFIQIQCETHHKITGIELLSCARHVELFREGDEYELTCHGQLVETDAGGLRWFLCMHESVPPQTSVQLKIPRTADEAELNVQGLLLHLQKEDASQVAKPAVDVEKVNRMLEGVQLSKAALQLKSLVEARQQNVAGCPADLTRMLTSLMGGSQPGGMSSAVAANPNLLAAFCSSLPPRIASAVPEFHNGSSAASHNEITNHSKLAPASCEAQPGKSVGVTEEQRLTASNEPSEDVPVVTKSRDNPQNQQFSTDVEMRLRTYVDLKFEAFEDRITAKLNEILQMLRNK